MSYSEKFSKVKLEYTVEQINHEIELLKKEATSENRQKRLTEKRVELEGRCLL